MILDLAIAVALLVQGFPRRRLLAASAMLSLFGVFATGQLSTATALALAELAFVVVARHGRLLMYPVPAGRGGGLPLLAAFVVTSMPGARGFARAAKGAGPSVTVAADAPVVAAVAAQVLSMLFDRQFTYRGSADAQLMVLDIARLTGRVHLPPRSRRPLDDTLRPWAPPTDSSKAAMT